MTSPHGIDQLRVAVPTLEPDPVLLARLVSLSSASAPAATSSRASSMKVLLAAAGVAVVATTTWAAGAVPGKLFPARPATRPHTVVTHTSEPTPTSGPTATRTPGASHPTSEAPGVHPTPPDRAGLASSTPSYVPVAPQVHGHGAGSGVPDHAREHRGRDHREHHHASDEHSWTSTHLGLPGFPTGHHGGDDHRGERGGDHHGDHRVDHRDDRWWDTHPDGRSTYGVDRHPPTVTDGRHHREGPLHRWTAEDQGSSPP